MMCSIRRACGVLACLLALSAAPAFAGAVTYTNYSDWSAATSGIVQVTFPSPTIFNTFLGSAPKSVTYSGIEFTISTGNLYNLPAGWSAGGPAMLSNSQAPGSYALLITFPEPVTAFSVDYGGWYGSNYTFLLSNGDSITQGSTNNGYPVYLTPDFFGVTDSAFTSVLITNEYDAINVSSPAYGAAESAVPEPATACLLLLGAAATGLAARRRRATR